MFGIRWWLTRPSRAVREERIRQGLCPRCGSPRTVPVIYGLVRDASGIRAQYPGGFVLGGDRVKSFDDPGPNRSCERCGYRFYADTLTPSTTSALPDDQLTLAGTELATGVPEAILLDTLLSLGLEVDDVMAASHRQRLEHLEAAIAQGRLAPATVQLLRKAGLIH